MPRDPDLHFQPIVRASTRARFGYEALLRDIDKHPMKQRLIRSVTELCHEQGTQVIGEGVETEAEAETLADLGCDLLQGYLIARPGPPFVDPL